MKNTSYKNKQFGLLGMAFLSVAGNCQCGRAYRRLDLGVRLCSG